jgi:hypothetical protein
MPLARIVSLDLEDARELAEELQGRGFDVEVVSPGEEPGHPADLEISLEPCASEDILRYAEAAPENSDLCVFIAPGAISCSAIAQATGRDEISHIPHSPRTPDHPPGEIPASAGFASANTALLEPARAPESQAAAAECSILQPLPPPVGPVLDPQQTFDWQKVLGHELQRGEPKQSDARADVQARRNPVRIGEGTNSALLAHPEVVFWRIATAAAGAAILLLLIAAGFHRIPMPSRLRQDVPEVQQAPFTPTKPAGSQGTVEAASPRASEASAARSLAAASVASSPASQPGGEAEPSLVSADTSGEGGVNPAANPHLNKKKIAHRNSGDGLIARDTVIHYGKKTPSAKKPKVQDGIKHYSDLD